MTYYNIKILLDSSSGMVPDSMHPMLLKSCHSLTYPLYLIIISSILQGALPAKWKVSKVIPISKKGTQQLALTLGSVRTAVLQNI